MESCRLRGDGDLVFLTAFLLIEDSPLSLLFLLPLSPSSSSPSLLFTLPLSSSVDLSSELYFLEAAGFSSSELYFDLFLEVVVSSLSYESLGEESLADFLRDDFLCSLFLLCLPLLALLLLLLPSSLSVSLSAESSSELLP